MIRFDFTLFLILCTLGIARQTPFGQYESPYSSHKSHDSLFERHLYGSSRSEDDRDADSHHLRHRSDHYRTHHQQPLVHHPAVESDRIDFQTDSTRNKRQAFLPYFPYFATLPPFYQVHNIYLTSPGYNCYPARPSFPDRRPSTGPNETVPKPDEDGLLNRFGITGTNSTETPSNKQPSKCVWSIVACCSPGSRDIRYACFELLGCPGAFWDVNPCDERVVTAAANSALKYYMNNQAPTAEPTFQHL